MPKKSSPFSAMPDGVSVTTCRFSGTGKAFLAESPAEMLTFGQLLAKIIKAFRAGQKHIQFSKETKVPCTTLYMLERGEQKTIKVEQLKKLAEGFNCTFQIIVGPGSFEYSITMIPNSERPAMAPTATTAEGQPIYRVQNPFSLVRTWDSPSPK